MSAGEIVAIVTGVLGLVTAIATPFVRFAFDQCTKYLKPDEDVWRYLLEEKQNVENMIVILSVREVPDKAQLSAEAWEIIGMIANCHDIETSDCFGFCWCLADYRKSYLVGQYVTDIKRRVKKLRNDLESRGVDAINALEGFGGNHISRNLVGEQAREVFEKIKTLVWKAKSGIIGVYGACGVGKTHVVRYVYESLQNQKDLFTLIWLEVSNRVDILTLQMEIANQIDLKLPKNGSVQDNAKEFKKALLKKYILLVLDDMRKTISTEEIGLPTHNMLIVITSRSFAVCSEMRCDDKIALKSLSDDEAYELLKIEIGTSRFLSKDKIQFTLKEIVKECGCLPLAIIAAAKSLRKYFEYHDVVLTERSLKMESAKFNNLKYIENKVIQDLKLSYEQLESSRYSCAKKCLLYCATYPRSHAFAATELMNNWMAEGLLREVEDIDEKLGEAKEILEELKDASLLKSTAYEDGEEIVKMHPIVWDMAVELEKEDPPPEELTSRSEMVIATSDMASSSS
ncbi:Disease resistance protein [Melia azedarach]|uniref:Disease resistance protein n=1 Tax=Melia azedarach TaxID=155640 RepID=A0ACC1Y711_MELAZ|nr:Disease resistance protein [Melia azedarach]